MSVLILKSRALETMAYRLSVELLIRVPPEKMTGRKLNPTGKRQIAETNLKEMDTTAQWKPRLHTCRTRSSVSEDKQASDVIMS